MARDLGTRGFPEPFGPRERATKHVAFDDSGVQDWAFVVALPQLSDEDPSVMD